MHDHERFQRKFRRAVTHVRQERLVRLLADAGFDAGAIPRKHRALALALDGCRRSGISDANDLAIVLGRSVELVMEVCGHLFAAGAS